MSEFDNVRAIVNDSESEMNSLPERKEISRQEINGVEVSSYTRTCGAAHNSSSSSSSVSKPHIDDEEKMRKRAELLYPTMEEKEENNSEKSNFKCIMPTEGGYISSYYVKENLLEKEPVLFIVE